MVDSDHLVTALRDAAANLVGARTIRDLDKTLGQIVVAAVQTVPGVDAGGLTVVEDESITSRSPTTVAVTKLDRLQADLHEGPCVSAIDDPPEDGVIIAQDLDGEDRDRWPRFAPHAVEAGFRAVMSTPLSTDRSAWAALNLYAVTPHVFDQDAHRIAGLFGVQAAVLLYGSEHAARLQRAVDGRDVIGQAKGILMERFGVDDAEAFGMLVSSSQETNLKVADIAVWLRDEARRRRSTRRADA